MILVALGLLLLLSLLVVRQRPSGAPDTMNVRETDAENMRRLLRQTARWATGAEQDTNAYIKNLHATYSVGYLMALREIYADEYVKELTGVNVRDLETQVTALMDSAMQQLIQVCPQGQPKNEFLAQIAKQG